MTRFVMSTYYADEMTLTFGNSPTITGRENIAVALPRC